MFDADPDAFIRAARELNRALGWLLFTSAILASPDVSRYFAFDFARQSQERACRLPAGTIAAMRLEWSRK